MRDGVTRGTNDWDVETVNCFTGCTYGCRYCWAMLLAEKRGYGSRETWGTMRPQRGVGRRNHPKYRRRVMFPSTHDIPDIRGVKRICFRELGQLLRAGNPVLIGTKPNPKVIGEIMERFERYKDRIEFMFTITTLDPETRQFWEPGAPSIDDRIEATELVDEAGWNISISNEPMLDPSPEPVVKAVEKYVTGNIWIGPMNYIEKMRFTEEEQPWVDEAKRISDPRYVEELYLTWKDYPKVRFKDEDKIIKRLKQRGVNPRGSLRKIKDDKNTPSHESRSHRRILK